MPKPDEVSVGGKVGFPGILEFLISGKFTSKEFRITEPEEKETSKSQVYIHGLGAHPESRVILINQVLGSGCYLQSDIGYPNSNGEWQALTKFSESSSGAERIIFALAVRETDINIIAELFNRSGKIRKIAEFERILKNEKIRYKISLGKRLIYKRNTPSKVSETTPTRKIVLFDEKNESMSVGPKIKDGVGGLFSGTYKVLHLSKNEVGKFLNITVESHEHHLWIEIFRGTYNGKDVEGWQAKRKEIYRSGGKKVNPSLKWKISDVGEYTIYFVTHSKEGKGAEYNISYKIEVLSNP